MDDWLGMWPDYNDYLDGATKATLANVQEQADKTLGGSDSVEIAGPARIAPVIAFLSDSSEKDVVQAAVEQTMLTHRSKEALESAVFLAQAGYRLMHGADLMVRSKQLHLNGHSKRQIAYSLKTQWTQSPNLVQHALSHPPSPPYSI